MSSPASVLELTVTDLAQALGPGGGAPELGFQHVAQAGIHSRQRIGESVAVIAMHACREFGRLPPLACRGRARRGMPLRLRHGIPE